MPSWWARPLMPGTGSSARSRSGWSGPGSGRSPSSREPRRRRHRALVVVQVPAVEAETACGTSTANCTGESIAARISGLRSDLTICTGTAARVEAAHPTQIRKEPRSCSIRSVIDSVPRDSEWVLTVLCFRIVPSPILHGRSSACKHDRRANCTGPGFLLGEQKNGSPSQGSLTPQWFRGTSANPGTGNAEVAKR